MRRSDFPAKLENLQKMQAFIRQEAEQCGFAAGELNKIQLAGEEALVNVINYAYPGKEGGLEISCLARNGGMEIEISDSGISFNPLNLPEPDINMPLEQRKIGGLGIYMIRKLMDQVTYSRDGEYNKLKMFLSLRL